MSYFQTLKDSITCRDAAEKYGLEVSRSGMARCPFHDDHTPSLKVDEWFYCFGCHAQGDVIDLTARLLGISNYSAAKQLALDFGIYPRPPTEEKIHKPKPPPATENFCLSVLMEYYRLQRFWKQQYAPGSPGEPFHEKFVETCHRSSFITHLIDEMMAADSWRRKQVMDILTEDDRLHRLQEYVMKKKMEETVKSWFGGRMSSGPTWLRSFLHSSAESLPNLPEESIFQRSSINRHPSEYPYGRSMRSDPTAESAEQKTLMPIIEQKLSKLFGGTASFQMELKKILRENKSLKSEVGDLERQLADNSKSILEELQKKQRMLELEEKERLLANIPLVIVEKYNKKYKEEIALEV